MWTSAGLPWTRYWIFVIHIKSEFLDYIRARIYEEFCSMESAEFAWFQASAARWMKSVLFWDITQHNSLQMFRENLPAPSSRVKKSKKKTLKMGPVVCREMSVMNCHCTLHLSWSFSPFHLRVHRTDLLPLRTACTWAMSWCELTNIQIRDHKLPSKEYVFCITKFACDRFLQQKQHTSFNRHHLASG
jgi:hypothetical protein